MSLLSFGYPRWLALAVPCALAAAALAPRPVLALAAPDARAVCLANGALVAARSENVNACALIAGNPGDYRVAIGNAVNTCTFVATLGLPGTGLPPAGQIAVSQGGANNIVRVQTRSAAGVPANRPFHLVVAC
jgi:hypothetical protein